MPTSTEAASEERLQELGNVVVRRTIRGWSSGLRIVFRFAFCYLVMYIFPFPLPLPFLSRAYEGFWHAAAPWMAKHVFHVPFAVNTFANGDTAYGYARVLSLLALGAVLTAVWSVIDRRRTEYITLHEWLRLYVRVMLACAILAYGANKVIPAQMSEPRLSTLVQPFGDLTSFGLLWNFMGFSPGYEIFAGAIEMLGGILLLVPGMTTLGAFVSMGAMSNVFMLNVCYDIPVKLLSFHLMLFSGFLLAGDARRLVAFFVLNREAASRRSQALFRQRSLNYALWGVQWALGIAAAATMLVASSKSVQAVRSLPAATPLYGIWKVDVFAADGKMLPPLLTDNMRWQRLVFDSPQVVSIQKMDGAWVRCRYISDTGKNSLSIKNIDGATLEANLSYTRVQAGQLIFQGKLGEHDVSATLEREDRQFILASHAIHWISDSF